ncbi:MAG: UDP-3-O-(3-hydroxymyristoyl)glucosamine N-acyltransferase [Flavobacteriales bacterium]|nr:UDP-3-O-(3-hydroxymyristoyl)glucosamine N-acyltransferase [Flavobacteriales bacterium]
MNFTASDIAGILHGEIEGNPNVTVNNLAKIEEGKPGTLTFLSNPKYTSFIYSTNSSIVIVANDFKPEKEISATLIKVEDPYQAFSTLLEYYNTVKLDKAGIEKPVFIAESAKYGDGIYIGAFAYIGENVVLGENVKIYPNVFIGDNVSIGDDTTLFAGVKIYSETIIGKNCNIHSGTVIGSDGFGFAPNSGDKFLKIPQIGNVLIEDFVEIGAGSTIDRATLGSTIIRQGVKLDNQIQIAHNVEIGKNTVIAAQTGIAGSSKVGERCMIGGQVGMVGHITIGDDVKIAAQTGINSSVGSNITIQGTPAMPINDFNKSYVYFRKFPELVTRLNQLEKNNNK